MFRKVANCLLGALPGLFLSTVSFRFGMAWAFVGVCVSALFVYGRPNMSRVSELLVHSFAGKNIPGYSQVVEPTSGPVQEDEAELNDKINNWLTGKDVSDRRDWVIATVFTVAAISSIIIAIHDGIAASEGRNHWFIKPKNVENFLVSLIVVPFFICSWTCGITGLLFSPAYRRPVGVFLSIPIIVYTAMMIAGGQRATFMFFCFGSIASAVGLAIGWVNAPHRKEYWLE